MSLQSENFHGSPKHLIGEDHSNARVADRR
jgi:hypothetical protein